MKKEKQKRLWTAISLLTGFALWTVTVKLVDVRSIGPGGSAVGLAGINHFVHSLTGVRMELYVLTDWLSLIPLCVVGGFAVAGLTQWIKRKQLRKVDRSILALGGLYIAMMAAYAFFEVVVINYRPVLLDGVLEASYPSSTTVLSICVMSTAVLQWLERVKDRRIRWWGATAMISFMIFMVTGRLISGVHWVTDIVGGCLLSGGLVAAYHAACGSD